MRVNKRAQGMLEYAVLIAIIVAVIVGMQIYVKRALQGKFKQTADQMGEQFTTNPTTAYAIKTTSISARTETVDPKTGTKSEIAAAEKAPAGVGVVSGDYKGYEVTKSDYVNATTGGGHSTFDSGVLKDTNLFED